MMVNTALAMRVLTIGALLLAGCAGQTYHDLPYELPPPEEATSAASPKATATPAAEVPVTIYPAAAPSPAPTLSDAQLASGSELRLPAQGRSDTLLVLFPPTGNTAKGIYDALYRSQVNPPITVLLAAGRGKTADYVDGEAWALSVKRYEQQLAADLDALRGLGLRPSRIYLGGYSLGGDLAWALIQRDPRAYDGALILSSRATWRNAAAPLALAQRQTRFFFSIGETDTELRLGDQAEAREELRKTGVPLRFESLSGGHQPPPAATFKTGLDYLLGRE